MTEDGLYGLYFVFRSVHPDPEDDFILDKEVTEEDKAEALKLKNEANQAFAGASPVPCCLNFDSFAGTDLQPNLFPTFC